MRLTDKVEVWEQGEPTYDRYGNLVPGELALKATLPANVSYSLSERSEEAGRTVYSEELRVIIPPYAYDESTMQIRWNGKAFLNDGEPMLRRKNGRDHHLTLRLRLTTG